MSMIILGHLFYFIGLLLFLANLGIIFKMNKILKTQNWAQAFFKVTSKKPERKDMPKDQYQDFMNFNSVMLFDFFWLFFGIITSSWKFFLCILSIVLLMNLIISQSESLKIISKFLNLSKILFLTISIGLLVINHFHLHLDLYETIVKPLFT